jgi:hypothetical protein
VNDGGAHVVVAVRAVIVFGKGKVMCLLACCAGHSDADFKGVRLGDFLGGFQILAPVGQKEHMRIAAWPHRRDGQVVRLIHALEAGLEARWHSVLEYADDEATAACRDAQLLLVSMVVIIMVTMMPVAVMMMRTAAQQPDARDVQLLRPGARAPLAAPPRPLAEILATVRQPGRKDDITRLAWHTARRAGPDYRLERALIS